MNWLNLLWGAVLYGAVVALSYGPNSAIERTEPKKEEPREPLRMKSKLSKKLTF